VSNNFFHRPNAASRVWNTLSQVIEELVVPIPDESAPWCTLWVMSHGEARSRVTMMFNQS